MKIKTSEGKKLQFIWSAIENELGYNLEIETMPQQYADHLELSVFRNPNKSNRWVMRISPGAKLNSITYCHELMHIVLNIEGWSSKSFDPRFFDCQEKRIIINNLSSISQHPYVWKMMDTLGFSEKKIKEQEIKEQLLPALRYKELARPLLPQYQPYIAATWISESLLSPAQTYLKDQVRSVSRINYPEALSLAESIISVFEKHAPTGIQDGLHLLLDLYSIFQVPKEILIFGPQEKKSPDFFDRLLRRLKAQSLI